jgi:type II secretory pathway component PulF
LTPSGRAVVYAFAWLPQLICLCFYIPRFARIFQKLEDKGELVPLTRSVIAFSRFNEATFYLPGIFALVLMFAAGEFIIARTRLSPRAWQGRAVWAGFVVSIGFLAYFIPIWALLNRGQFPGFNCGL